MSNATYFLTRLVSITLPKSQIEYQGQTLDKLTFQTLVPVFLVWLYVIVATLVILPLALVAALIFLVGYVF